MAGMPPCTCDRVAGWRYGRGRNRERSADSAGNGDDREVDSFHPTPLRFWRSHASPPRQSASVSRRPYSP
jgi:hypothetical protein